MTKDIGIIICIQCRKINHQTKQPVEGNEKGSMENLDPRPVDPTQFRCRFCGGTKFWAGLRKSIPGELK